MPVITSLDSLEHALRQAGGTPKVLEALWDGDTQGWYLCLSVYTEVGVWPLRRTERHELGTVLLGTDLRLFNGQVPPWPEAELVKLFVQQPRYRGLTLYLPSEEPDDDCPRWTERASARACADCGKLGTPSDSPYLPRDVCYNCHLRREQTARLQQEQPCDEGVNLYRHKEGVYHSLGYATHFEDLGIAPYLDSALLLATPPPAIQIVTLGREHLVVMQAQLAEALERKLAHYKPLEKDPRKAHFYHFHNVCYQGATYELEIRRHKPHEEISSLFYNWESLGEALADGADYKIYFKRGFTHRDDALLRYLKYPAPLPRTSTQLVQQYQGVLTEQQVQRTLGKLEAMGCLTRTGDTIAITQTGCNIV